MHRLIVRRLMATIPVMATVAITIFLILRLSPGDPAAFLAGDTATPEDIHRIHLALGLDKPILVQFFIWVNQLLHGDLGRSIISNLPVTQLISERFRPTLAITIATTLVAIPVAVPLGILAARYHEGWIDWSITAFSVLGFSLPTFVLGYLWIYGFAVKLHWLPVQGYVSLTQGVGPFLRSLILPTLTLSGLFLVIIARITRASMLEVMGEDYIRTAYAKGLADWRVLVRHGLANAAAPIVTVIGLGISLLISGAVVTESLFNIPGLGRLTVDALLARDYPVLQGLTLIFSLVYVLINFIVDIIYMFFDPRITC